MQDAGDKDAAKNIKDTDLEPVFLNGLPMQVWKNIMMAYRAKGSIVLAAGAGDACKASMLLRQPCLAICLSDAHVKYLFDHLVHWMLTCMEDQTNVFYNQNYRKWKAGGTAVEQPPLPTPSPPKSPRKRSRDRSEKTTKNKKRRKSGGKKTRSSSSSSSSED